jgi:hypothetical protein
MLPAHFVLARNLLKVNPMRHCGVSVDDQRNAGVIAYFKPKEISRGDLLKSLKEVASENPTVERVLRDVEHGRIKPNPPLSQSLDELPDPLHGLDTHPDIVQRIWKLDETLPQSCRWVFWGKPSLVHPQTGVVFAVGFGTIGLVLRLPSHVLNDVDPKHASQTKFGNPGQVHDIGLAGPEWRFVAPQGAEIAWCRSAYDFASRPQ